MRLLFDENLPSSLCQLLEDLYPDSVHALEEGLGGGDRSCEIAWCYFAASNSKHYLMDGAT